jgi:hypothetical protein
VARHTGFKADRVRAVVQADEIAAVHPSARQRFGLVAVVAEPGTKQGRFEVSARAVVFEEDGGAVQDKAGVGRVDHRARLWAGFDELDRGPGLLQRTTEVAPLTQRAMPVDPLSIRHPRVEEEMRIEVLRRTEQERRPSRCFSLHD